MTVVSSPQTINPAPSTEGSSSDRDIEFYANATRFELELEFVQSLANPLYLNHLAAQKLLDDPSFVAYLDYLRYFRAPPYLRHLQYPGPTLRALELLQQEAFRREILMPATVERMIREGFEAATATATSR